MRLVGKQLSWRGWSPAVNKVSYHLDIFEKGRVRLSV